jgi:hypothetical protein
VIDNVVWTDSWLSIAGVGCGLICVVQVKNKCERSMHVWPSRSGETSRLGSRYPVADGIKCGPHGAKKSKM